MNQKNILKVKKLRKIIKESSGFEIKSCYKYSYANNFDKKWIKSNILRKISTKFIFF